MCISIQCTCVYLYNAHVYTHSNYMAHVYTHSNYMEKHLKIAVPISNRKFYKPKLGRRPLSLLSCPSLDLSLSLALSFSLALSLSLYPSVSFFASLSRKRESGIFGPGMMKNSIRTIDRKLASTQLVLPPSPSTIFFFENIFINKLI